MCVCVRACVCVCVCLRGWVQREAGVGACDLLGDAPEPPQGKGEVARSEIDGSYNHKL